MASAGIIGLGWIGEIHAQALKEKGIELRAVVGRDPVRTKAFAEKWNVPYYGTSTHCLYEAAVDCVHICTPPDSHFELIRELLAHGKHILCEKPLCLENTEAQALAALAEKEKLVCAVGFNVRYYLACQKAKELVQSPAFGRVLLIHGSYLQEFGANPARWSWRYAHKLHAVTEIGSHWLDLAQYISGQRVTALSAQLDRFHPLRYEKDGLLYTQEQENSKAVAVPSEDVALLSLRFSGGALGSVVLSELSHGRANRLSLEITGENESLWWNSEAPEQLFLARKGELPQVLSFSDDFFQTFCRLMDGVYHAISGKTADYPAFARGGENVRLCDAAWESSRDNSKWVEV